MPKSMKPEKTTPRNVLHETDLRYAKTDRDALLFDVTERLQFNTDRLHEMAKLLVSKPRPLMNKRELKKMLSDLWDMIPETVQLVARDGLPESALYGRIKAAVEETGKEQS